MVGRKWPTIDIVSIYSKADHAGWNAMLRALYDRQDVNGLVRVLYGLQAGMSDAASSGVADEKLRSWFLRAQRSLENTAKMIFRKKYPSPLDNPSHAQMDNFSAAHAAKKKRDQEFESFMRRSRF